MRHAPTLSSTTTDTKLPRLSPQLLIWTTLLVIDIVAGLFLISLSNAPQVSNQNYSDDAALDQQTISASFIGS